MRIVIGIVIYILLFTLGLMFFHGTRHDDKKGGSKDA